MGTLLSSIPVPPLWRDDTCTWEKSFQQGLLSAAAERNRKGSTVSSKQNLILSYKTSEGILGDTHSDELNARNVNNNVQSQSRPRANTSSSSRAPIPPNNRNRNSDITLRSRKAVDINENPAVNRVRDREPSRASTVLDKYGVEKQSSESSVRTAAEKSYQPEQWPTLQMIHEQLDKTGGDPSTIIFARFHPNRPSSGYVEILYSICEETNEIVFQTSDKLDTLIAPKDGFTMGTTKEDEIKYFMLIFKTCINNLQGNIWWNGFSIVLDQNNRNRLKVSAFELQPSQLLFELVNMKDLEVHRTLHRVDLKGKTDGSSGGDKYIRFRGVAISDIKVNQLRGNLITVHLPRFNQRYITY